MSASKPDVFVFAFFLYAYIKPVASGHVEGHYVMLHDKLRPWVLCFQTKELFYFPCTNLICRITRVCHPGGAIFARELNWRTLRRGP